eukprot:3571607-Rhodomonas_salina.3
MFSVHGPCPRSPGTGHVLFPVHRADPALGRLEELSLRRCCEGAEPWLLAIRARTRFAEREWRHLWG